MTKPPSARKAVRFGVFEVDLDAGELHKSGLKVHLQEQPFQVLAALLERAGEIVTREELIQKLWPDGTFVEFDRSLNIAVNKIREALGDSAHSPRFVETVPRRGYRFVTPVEVVGEPAPPQEAEPVQPRKSGGRSVRLVWFTVLTIALIAGGIGVWLGIRSTRSPQESTRARPLTSYRGDEIDPAFSPTGTEIAFSWNGPDGDNFNIYRYPISLGETRLQLTDDPADDLNPAWSPDGNSVAFLRPTQRLPLIAYSPDVFSGKTAVITVPSIGGSEKLLMETQCGNGGLDWSPDGEWLAVIDRVSEGEPCGVFLVSTTGERKFAAAGPAFGAPHSPSFSPDGRKLAFVVDGGDTYRVGSLHVLDLSEDRVPRGDAREIATGFYSLWNPVWTQDGAEIIFTGRKGETGGTWKVQASGAGKPVELPIGPEAGAVALSRQGNRLAYVRRDIDSNIWRVEMPGPGQEGRPAHRLVSSTRGDAFPKFSPDGRRIALQSSRSGLYQIWVCDPEGENCEQLTKFDRGWSAGSPWWSPDGKRIAFDTNIDGQWEIYIVPASGGKPTRLTKHPADDYGPSWSRDGEWIYFRSNRSGTANVWKKPVGGGEAVQVTEGGGTRPVESVDGQSVYYLKADTGDGGLWQAPSGGGEEVEVLSSIIGPRFSVVEDGIFFISRPGPDGGSSIQFYSFTHGQARAVAPIVGSASASFADCEVSPDRKWILFRRVERSNADIFLVESLR